jgi:hypothetical protein
MPISSISGAFSVRRRSTSPGANPGAKATIPSSSPRLPTGRALHGAARERHRHLRRRKALDPGSGAGAGISEASERSSADGHSHDYKRNGTTTLFAAFEVATGKVTAAHKKRRRRVEFLDFMNDIVPAHTDTAIHIILDNLNTHKPKNDRWLKRHPNVNFHFTPTRASWLNQVEIWFSILEGKSLHGASLTSMNNFESTSMLLSIPTTKPPSRLFGPKPRSIKNASTHVSPINDSGY